MDMQRTMGRLTEWSTHATSIPGASKGMGKGSFALAIPLSAPGPSASSSPDPTSTPARLLLALLTLLLPGSASAPAMTGLTSPEAFCLSSAETRCLLSTFIFSWSETSAMAEKPDSSPPPPAPPSRVGVADPEWREMTAGLRALIDSRLEAASLAPVSLIVSPPLTEPSAEGYAGDAALKPGEDPS